MGKYINKDAQGNQMPFNGKVDAILKGIPGAKIIDRPEKFEENIVCVADAIIYDAAIWCYSERELDYIKRAEKTDERAYIWMIVPGVEKLIE